MWFSVFMMYLHANNILSTPFTHKTTTPRIFWCFPFFSSPKKKKTSMTPYFHKDFWEIKVLIQNKNQIGVCSNKQVLKIQVIS
jgi:hypothetical protein